MVDSACPTCGRVQDDDETLQIEWICCDICHRWYHATCVDVKESEIKLIREFHCPNCSKFEGPSLLTRTSSRHHKRIDYIALNEGDDPREVNHHPHIEDFNSFQNDQPIDELVYLVDPKKDCNELGILDDSVLMNIILKTRLKKPILIRGCNPSVKPNYDRRIHLNFKFPRFNIEQLTELIGHDLKVPVMDVMTQNNSPNWTMDRWRDYFKKDPEDRDKIKNVISLEFSETDLGKHVEIPKVVRDVDIVSKLFDSALGKRLLDAGIERPKVTKYVLMSVADAFTDFHIDFAGTSVYYTILSGKKQFLMYPPTDRNLDLYKKWCDSDDQNSIWFGDLVPTLTLKEQLKYEGTVDPAYINNGFKVDINSGDLLLLPSGWIHAVYTPSDSLIIGGNFLNLLSLENHLKSYEIEVDIKVPDKFKFPSFLKIVWLIGWYLKEEDPNLISEELLCLASLLQFYKKQWAMVNDVRYQEDKKLKRVIQQVRHSIPLSIIGKVDKFIIEFEAWYKFRLKEANIADDFLALDELPSKRQRRR
ncbi:DEKNAAC100421 [Brettanomyces naardenensis]|uniref:JmjC domain-containing histone demethylation protein 1 n=1 Tax=Brettanomyces naardenensis TaxID=13370 RepID=A0A448YEZ5_BRENA|nr:DEKNAAC100421 [Brettanomyces naardenensis]